jgi:hypothetical protein
MSPQELSKAGLNGMEQTVEKYIQEIPPDSMSSIVSPSTVSDSAMLAQMVSAIKQKLFDVATELVSSALKGGDRLCFPAVSVLLCSPAFVHSILKAELYKLASIPVIGSRPISLPGSSSQAASPCKPPLISPTKCLAAAPSSQPQVCLRSCAYQA